MARKECPSSIASFRSLASKGNLASIPEEGGPQALSHGLDWLRKGGVAKDLGKDDMASCACSMLGNISSAPLLAEESRAKDMADALSWLPTGDALTLGVHDDPSVASFKSIGGTMRLAPAETADEMAQALA